MSSDPVVPTPAPLFDPSLLAGSVSHGTLRQEDLTRAAIIAALRLCTVAYVNGAEGSPAWAAADRLRRHAQTIQAIRAEQTPDRYYDTEAAVEDYADLLDAVNAVLVACHVPLRFGMHEGDGSDLGFWPNDDEG